MENWTENWNRKGEELKSEYLVFKFCNFMSYDRNSVGFKLKLSVQCFCFFCIVGTLPR